MKAQNLLKEDAVSNVMELLEMYCSVVLERFADLEKECVVPGMMPACGRG